MRAQLIRRLSVALPLLLATSSFAAEPPAQLLLPSRELEANSTFELRFASEMVRPDLVGKPAELSPLVLDPVIAGRFVWLSTRSGTFAPDAILPLGTKFKISLRPGTKDVGGKAIPTTLRETAETPPFRVKGANAISYVDKDNATVLPRYLVLFNANVSAATAAKYCRFINAAGARVDAQVEQAGDPRKRERTFPAWQSDDRLDLAWGEQSAPVPPPSDDEESESEDTTESNPGRKLPPPRRNVLFITPVKPLTPGPGWRLVLEAGLPAAESKITLPVRREFEIGIVQPFRVVSLKAESNRTDGRRLILELNKTLADDVTADGISKWIKVTPAPPNLKAAVEQNMVTLRGDFALDFRYRVSVGAGLPAHEPVTIATPFSQEVAFEKIAARLYFSDFSVHQFTGGTRQLRLVGVNVPRVRISAKLFTGDAIPIAVKAYDKYQEYSENLLPDESYSRVNVEELPGTVIWEKEFTPAGAVDTDQTITLNWDEIVGANKSGAVLLTAESLDPILPAARRVGTQSLVQLTALGAIWKRDRGSTFLHLFSLATGKGIPSLRLQLLDTEGKMLADAVTDRGGDARLPKDDEMRWIFAQGEKDAHLIALSSGENSLPLYRLGVNVDGTIRVSLTANTYAEWQTAFGSGAFEADDDGDGIPNGVEFLLGTNPNVPFGEGQYPLTELPRINSPTDTTARVTFQIPVDPASDARYRVSASSNLVNWTTIASKDGAGPWTGTAAVTIDPAVGGVTRITVTESLPLGTGRRFHRLEAGLP